MATFSDNFDTDFASRWTNLFGTPFWDDNAYHTESGTGSWSAYNTTSGGLTQYVRFKQLFGEYSGGVFRSTGVGSAGFYAVCPYNGTNCAWLKCNNTGIVATISDVAFTHATNDVIGMTCTGTGSSTVIKVWRNPTNNTPFDVNNWDSATDPADLSFTTPGANNVDVGNFVGIGIDTSAVMDDFFGGAIITGSPTTITAVVGSAALAGTTTILARGILVPTTS